MPHSYGRILSFPYFKGRRNRPSISGSTGNAIAKTKKTITGKYAVDGPPMCRAVVVVACSKSIALSNYSAVCERGNIKWRVRLKSIAGSCGNKRGRSNEPMSNVVHHNAEAFQRAHAKQC